MHEKPMAEPFLSMIEARIRAFWTKLGAAVERSVGPGSRQHYDINTILDSIERKLESNLQSRGDRVQAPDHIELRFDYETYARISDAQRSHLIHELEGNLKEFIHNRRYITSAPVRVELAFDAFAKRLDVRARFSEATSTAELRPANPTSLKLKTVGRSTTVKDEIEAWFDDSHLTLGLGRSRDNALVIDDATVSNFHASFTLNSDGSIWLADLGSSNGTEIDQVVLIGNDRGQVRHGSHLRFGDVRMTVVLAGLTHV
jgi:hypothetical protein